MSDESCCISKLAIARVKRQWKAKVEVIESDVIDGSLQEAEKATVEGDG
jgi:hypothetical protein